MPSVKIIGLLILEKKIYEGFWWPSWSCDLDNLYRVDNDWEVRVGNDRPLGAPWSGP